MKRSEARAAHTEERPADILRTTPEKELGYERWLERELDRAEAEAGRGELVSSEEVTAEARALIRRHARLRYRPAGSRRKPSFSAD